MWFPRRRHSITMVLVSATVLTGCLTGQRPRLDEEQASLAPTGNVEIDAVLDRLDRVDASLLTAEYEISGANGEVEQATVVLADSGRRSITVGDTRYLVEGDDGITCNLDTAECEASLNDARISDLQLTHEFYGPAFAKRLRVDAGRRIQDPEQFSESVGGADALCVRVPVTGGDKVYCALESGALARYQGPDTDIELTRVQAEPDEALFATDP